MKKIVREILVYATILLLRGNTVSAGSGLESFKQMTAEEKS